MQNPSYFGFLNHDPLWDEDEAIKQGIHNLIEHGEDIAKSTKHKVARAEYLIGQEAKQKSWASFQTWISPENMRIRKLRAQRLDHTLRPYWEWLIKYLHYECQACLHVFNPADLVVDHCQPLSRGGKNQWDNIQPLCQSCNSQKNTRAFISPEVIKAQKEWRKQQKRSQCQKKPRIKN